MQKPIQRVKVTNVTQKFETKIFRSDKFCPGEPHQRSPNAPKFEDRSQEETEWQEQGAREAAWRLARNVFFNLKEQERATFFSMPQHGASWAWGVCPNLGDDACIGRQVCWEMWKMWAEEL